MYALINQLVGNNFFPFNSLILICAYILCDGANLARFGLMLVVDQSTFV